MYEIESKFKIKGISKNDIMERLIEAGASLTDEVTQSDIVFHHITQNSDLILPGDKIFRIREEISSKLSRIILTLKIQQTEGLVSKEYETIVQSFDQTYAMLNELLFFEFLSLKKERIKGKINEWNICIDYVHNLGNFIELECLSSSKDNIEDIKASMLETIVLFGDHNNFEEVTLPYDTLLRKKQ